MEILLFPNPESLHGPTQHWLAALGLGTLAPGPASARSGGRRGLAPRSRDGGGGFGGRVTSLWAESFPFLFPFGSSRRHQLLLGTWRLMRSKWE